MRIISLVPSATETLFALGLGDDIVGVTRFCRFPEESVKSKEKVGGTKNPKLDRILSLNPDIVMMDQDENRKEDAEFLKRHGIRIYASFCKSPEDAANMIDEMGTIFSRQSIAAEISYEIRERLAPACSTIRRKSLILIWRRPYMSINSDTYVHSIADLFGFTNVFADKNERYPKVTELEIQSADPEVVLFPDEPFPFREKHISAFRMEFPELSAVRNDQLISLDGTFFTWHGYGTLRAMRQLPKVVESLSPSPTEIHIPFSCQNQ